MTSTQKTKRFHNSGFTLIEMITAGMVMMVVTAISVNSLIGGLKLSNRTMSVNNSVLSARSATDLLTQDISMSDTCLSTFAAGGQTFNADTNSTLILRQPFSSGGIVVGGKYNVVIYTKVATTGLSSPYTLRRYACLVDGPLVGSLVNTGDVSKNVRLVNFAYFCHDRFKGDGVTNSYSLTGTPLVDNGATVFEMTVGSQKTVDLAVFGPLGDLKVVLVGSGQMQFAGTTSTSSSSGLIGSLLGPLGGSSNLGSGPAPAVPTSPLGNVAPKSVGNGKGGNNGNGGNNGPGIPAVHLNPGGFAALLEAIEVYLDSHGSDTVEANAVKATQASLPGQLSTTSLNLATPTPSGTNVDLIYPIDPRNPTMPNNGLNVLYVMAKIQTKGNKGASKTPDGNGLLEMSTKALLRNKPR